MVDINEFRMGIAPRYESGMCVGDKRVWVIGASIIVTDVSKTVEHGRKPYNNQAAALANLSHVVIMLQAGRSVAEALS